MRLKSAAWRKPSVLGTMLVMAGTAGADPADPQPLARLRDRHPGVSIETRHGRVYRVFGVPMTRGATARAAAEGWLADHAGVFAGPGLDMRERWTTRTVSGKAFFAYEQSIDGLPVPGSQARLMVIDGPSPAVVYAAARVSPHAATDLPDPRLTGAEAVVLLAAHAETKGVTGWDAPTLVAHCGDDLLGAPVPKWRATGRSADGRPFVAYVDALDGTVGPVHDVTLHARPDPITGTVRGWVLPGLEPYWGAVPTQCQAQPALALMANVEVRVVRPSFPTPPTTFTGSDGAFVLPVETTRALRLEARLNGPSWETRHCFDGGFSCFPGEQISVQSRNVRAGGTANLTLQLPTTEPAREFAIGQMTAHALVSQAHAHMASRGALGMTPPFLRVWVQHDFVVECNALYDLTNVMIRTPAALAGCPNMAYASVVTHEWAHYFAHAVLGFGVENDGYRSFHEGYADSLAVLVHDSPLIGPNVLGCGSTIRDISNPRCVYPGCPDTNGGRCRAELNVSLYDRSEILSGVWWDVRQLVGLETAQLLHVDWSLLTMGPNAAPPECPTRPQAAGPDTLTEVALAADDDGTLSNGTPYDAEICAAFLANGIEPSPEVTLCAESGPGTPCAADCDISTGRGALDVFDMMCFMERFRAADPRACDCDTTTGPGTCDVLDFLCFQSAFAAGCR